MKIVKLKDLTINGKGTYGIAAPAVDWQENLPTYLRITDIFDDGTLNFSGLKSVSDSNTDKYFLRPNDIVFARTGGSTGRSYFYDGTDGKFVYAGFLIKFSLDSKKVNPKYIKYFCLSESYKKWVHSFNTGSTRGNLQQQAIALYRQMFVETNNDARRECRADECFDISIGKTPPRKEAQWFSMNPTDCIWVSISDMGSCGLYIADSSEYLTQEAVGKFNIKVVPDNTVLLSFKLTVGRVAISDGAMATNEAIAHFKTDKPEINEYLYCYLKNFNYQTMGSTSSIATAVNSKIIKAMPFVVPTDAELVTFHSVTAPMFEIIKTHQRENTRLAELRDSLLPKLMSGEIDVSAVQL